MYKDEEDDSLVELRQEPQKCFQRRWIVLWALSILVAVAFTRLYSFQAEGHLTPVEHIAALDGYSPIYRDIDLHLDPVTPDGHLWDNGTSIWRRFPSPEVDAAWDSLIVRKMILVSKEDVLALGQPLEGAVQWPDDPTGNTYIGKVDHFHLMHCVDELRKGMHMDHYETYRPLHPAYWTHKYHCLDMIRQELMCTASLNVHIVKWSEWQDTPIPDFQIHRTCRRREDLVRWNDEHGMSMEDMKRLEVLEKPPGAYAYPTTPYGLELREEIKKWAAEKKAKEAQRR